ncbi:MAG: hypothetical protein KTR15_11955 [Phycisphaeraceae bacterium]|nr:hypothetical protein [Phycisphaeraceae bacterium]
MNTPKPTINPQQDASDSRRHPRCLACGYRLVGLHEAVCPECGRPFDPDNERTFSRKPPFIWYLYWWPGALLSVGAGFAWCVAFYLNQSLGWGIFIAVPFMIGALVGYRPSPKRRTGLITLQVVGLICALILVLMLMAGEFAGVLCGVMLILIFFVPTLGGFYFGILGSYILATILKNTRFSQREHLPVILGLLLLPGIAHLAERAFAPPIEVETVQTEQLVPMGQMQAWGRWVFYEEVTHGRPWLLRLGLPTPSHVEGKIHGVGDRQACVYTGDARLVKQATHVVPGEVLAFDVIEQHKFENNSIRLIDGAFDFERVADDQTRVTLTTRYEPLLRPRVLWQPIEHAFAHELHRHVLRGMVEPKPPKTFAKSAERSRP